MAGKKIDNK